MKIIAHRGVTNSAPQNTMAAFLDAARQGYGVECDVRLTKDSVPVILHDDSLKRTTEDSRRLNQVSLAELEGILIAGQHPVPTLESVIKHVLPEAFVNFNIKEDAAVNPVLKLLNGANLSHGVLLSAHSVNAVRRLQANFNDVAFVHSWLPIALIGAIRSQTKAVVIRDWPINRWFIKRLVKAGYSVYVWGKAPDPNKLRARGASGLIKDI